MAELLIELFSEEIPARMQARAADALQDAMTRSLADARLTAAEVETFVTPRRLVLVARDLPTAQPDLTEERKGPRVGAPDKAVQGFLRAAGLESLDQCETRSAPKGDFYIAIRQIPGRPAAEVLPGLIAEAILGLPWPKSMRWGRGAVRYVRPLHHVLAVFDGKVLAGALAPGDAADPAATPGLVAAGTEGAIPFTDHSRGHRFLAPDPFPVRDFASYRTRLREGWVLLDRAERRQVIADDLARLAANEGLKVRPDDGLLDEVTGLVEWPVALIGRIDDQFMDLPPEVLATAMRSHQKYFTLVDDRDRMAPRFGVVANMVAEDGGAAIIAGNERVLRARLADARFFWDQDRKHPLDSRVGDLDALIFHARLGAMGEKVHRLQALAVALAPHVPGAELERVRSAARLAKADLVTGMVGEFPELQGIMGQYYARHDGNDPAVCAAVAEHYAPAGPADTCPTAPVSVAVALADKIDTLVGFFGIDEKPTGSKDPYALRRAALGVIRLVLENGLRLPLLEVFAEARDLYRRQCHLAEDTPDALLAFFADRLKVHLRDKGVRHDLIDAVFALGAQDDIALLLARVDALADFLATDDGANLLTAYRRASNIVGIEEKKDGVRYHGMPDGDAMREPEEHALRARLSEVAELADPALARAEYRVAMAALARLRKPLDDFFDRVTVNAEDPDLRANRLRLLSAIRTTMNRIADFSRIEG